MHKFAKQYGPIYKRVTLGKVHIIVTKEHIAHELLAQRGAIYSDRPGVPSIYDSRSDTGTGEYLPLMGKNGEIPPGPSTSSIFYLQLLTHHL
jgi:hypothetical protein